MKLKELLDHHTGIISYVCGTYVQYSESWNNVRENIERQFISLLFLMREVNKVKKKKKGKVNKQVQKIQNRNLQ